VVGVCFWQPGEPSCHVLTALHPAPSIHSQQGKSKGELTYREFLAATLHHSRLQEEPNIALAFQHFNKQGGAAIGVEGLREALAALGMNFAVEAVAQMLQAADQSGDGAVSYSEFSAMMMMAPSSSSAAAAGGLSSLRLGGDYSRLSRGSDSSSVLSMRMSELGSGPCSPSSCVDCLTPRVGLRIQIGGRK